MMLDSVVASDSIPREVQRYKKAIGLYYQAGMVLQAHGYEKGDNPTNTPLGLYQGLSAKYAIHTDGREQWQQLYAYPVWGFGFYAGFISNDKALGSPLAVYSFINLPIKRYRKWSIGYEVEFGVSFNWENHEPNEDQYYYPVGSNPTVFFDMGPTATIPLGKNFDLTTGLSFTHYSNGAIEMPNLGINAITAKVELQYIFKERPDFKSFEIPEYKREWEWVILLAPSMKQQNYTYTLDDDTTLRSVNFNYPILSLSTYVNRQISHKIKFGGGIDITYNEAYASEIMVEDNVPVKKPFDPIDKILIGIFPSFELVLNKLCFVAQPGYYIYRKKDESLELPSTYQRIGIKYHFLDHLVIGVNLRAYDFSRADFIEFLLGYRLKWQKSYRKGH